MFQLNVTADTRQLVQLSQDLSDSEVRKAVTRAINRALQVARTRDKREITAQYNMKAGDVTARNLMIVPSTRATLTGTMRATANPESLGHFNPKQYMPGKRVMQRMGSSKDAKGKRTPVYGKKQLKRSSGKSGVYFQVVRHQERHIAAGFILMKQGGPIVMARGKYDGARGFSFGKSRLPITKLNTKSVYFATLHPNVAKQWFPPVADVYYKELQRQLSGAVKFGR